MRGEYGASCATTACLATHADSSSHFGHDKSLEIKPYAALPEGERPILLYAGDGVSDLSAAAETNLLFAKQGKGKCVPEDLHSSADGRRPGYLL